MFFFLSVLTRLPDVAIAAVYEKAADDQIAELIEEAKSGDMDAFSALLERYQKYIYHTAVRLLSSRDRDSTLADDIVQDTFLKVWNSLDSFRGECAFSTWLFRVTVNTARDHLRREVRQKTVSLTREDGDEENVKEWDVPVTSGDEVPESALDRRETILAVRRAVEELPPDQKAVIVMRDLNDLPYQDIADALGISLGTLKSRLSRGRQNLKIILQNGNFL